jgi:hypothetical protein
LSKLVAEGVLSKSEDESNEAIVEQVAKALYDHQVSEAKRQVDEFDFEAEDMEDLFIRLVDESETAQILIFFSYLDDRVKAIISAKLIHIENRTAEERLFGLNGPLSTFNTRTLMAFHLGWLSPKQKKRLDALRRIRNAFGHKAFKISFEDQEIVDLWARIDINTANILETVTPELCDFPVYGIKELPAPRERLCRFAVLANRTFEELIVLPVARSLKVSPNDICRDFDSKPDMLKRLSEASARAILRSIQRDGSEVASLDNL